MALTAAQESVLEQLIEAFQNGKRLSDLPNVKGTNPFDLYLEVLDTDGESKKAALASLLPYVEDQCAYGVERDIAVSSPTCTRIGNMALHKSLPIQNRMRGVILNDNGDVVEYLDPKDWTGQKRDGSRGQVMVEIPLHYRRFITDGSKQRVLISEFPLPGYHQVPKQYISAYEASVQRSTKTLCSVVNDSVDYRGGDNQAAYDGTYRSLLGRPVTSISRTDFRAYARKRKAGSTEWNCMTYDIQKTLYWLFVVEYATLNTQAAYNAELTAEGYKQGGLGAGVTTWGGDVWGRWNRNNPFVPCGHTDSLGNGTGVVQYTVQDAKGADLKTFDVPRYHGIENPFGHIWQWADGINVRISPTKEDGGDDLSKVFVCSDPDKFNDSNYTGYSHVGNEARDYGYVKEIIFGEGGEIIPSLCTGGGSTTFFCDYHATTIPTTETLRGVVFSGGANSGAKSGFALAYSIYAPSTTLETIGSRLCFLPKSE